jgi:lipopolysaccharide biosynthesis glycosyltransferase
MDHSIWIGFDPREAAAFAVCRHSIDRRMTQQIPVRGLVLSKLQAEGLYTRPIEFYENGQLKDVLSDAPMSTEFAVSRFLTPLLAKEGWALFMDCDVLVRESLCRLFEIANSKYAVMVVKHQHNPDYGVKMDGQIQTRYARKNWSSVMLFNCEHPANKALTLEMVNTLPGRDLHRFCWLDDEEIGELDPCWNYLVGHTKAEDPKIVHYTDGIPTMRGYEHCEYADEWRAELERWASQS